MMTEVADIRIDPSQQQAFEKAIVQGVETVIAKATGFVSYRVQRCIETPARYLLQIEWQTLENHTKDFRESEAFAQWRAIVGPFFASPPVVEHFETLD